MKEKLKKWAGLIAVGLLAVGIMVCGAWAWGSVKASAYNNATGKSITWYEALMLDPKLRD
jgi:hypothetical protein